MIAKMDFSPNPLWLAPTLNVQSHPWVQWNVTPGFAIVCAAPFPLIAAVKTPSMSEDSERERRSWLRLRCLYATLKKKARMSAPANRTNIQWNCISNPLRFSSGNFIARLTPLLFFLFLPFVGLFPRCLGCRRIVWVN